MGDVYEVLVANLDALAAVKRMHHPVTLWLPHPDADWSLEDYFEAAEYATDDIDTRDPETVRAALAGISSFQVCAECKDIERDLAADLGYEHAAWPCRTARAWGAT